MSTQLPEPHAHPGVLDEPTGAFAAIRSRVGPKRLNSALFIVGLCWVGANSFTGGTLLAAKIAILVPDDKVFFLSLATALAGVVSTFALFLWGAISDLTRSRFGRRTPWILFGGAAGGVGMMLIGLSTGVGGLLAAFLGYCLLNAALPSAVLAVFPDRVPRNKRGTASAVYGAAQVIGGAVAGIIASRFINNPDPLFFAGGVIWVVGAVAFALLAPDFSNRDEPRAALDKKGLRAAFAFPANAPDFYWAFAGRFLLLLGLAMIQGFQLYIMTDYIGLSDEETANTIAISGVASLFTIVIGTVVAGPISDKIQRRRVPIFVASLLFGVAVLLPLLSPTATSMILFGAISGLGLGAFLSVSSALMTEVLPDETSRGKDLGILNTANTVPNIIAPLLTSLIVGSGVGYGPVFLVSLVIIVIGAFSIFRIRSVR